MPLSLPANNRILYGAQTQLALENFPDGGRRLSDVPTLIRAYAHVKAAAAHANARLDVLDPERAAAIADAAEAIASGAYDDQFPLALVQGGGGTSTNMNFNEVIAHLATRALRSQGSSLGVHPNDHVNRSQSTNDTYPTAMALALYDLCQPALSALDQLQASLLAKAGERDDLLRLGRTCLQDAVLITVGQTHRGQAHAVGRTRDALARTVRELQSIPLGATAVGTGVGAPQGFPEIAVEYLRLRSGQDLSVSSDFFDSLANLDSYSAVANACVRAALVIAKIAADVRLLSSGPVGGLGEIAVPALQAGSSIMPGKVNPVIPELVMQLSYRIRGAAATVENGVAAGELELNVMEPIVFDALVSALQDLTDAAQVFATKCIDGLTWNDDAVERNARGALDHLVGRAVESGYQSVVDTLAQN